MPLFKDPVALEACPAKTAESVGYGATFAVLAWLVASNYSASGPSGLVTTASAQIPATTQEQSEAPISESDEAQSAIELDSPAVLEGSTLLAKQSQTEDWESNYTTQSELTAWHKNLQPTNPTGDYRRDARFSSEGDKIGVHADIVGSPLLQLALDLAPASIESDYLKWDDLDVEQAQGAEVKSQDIRQITVTGRETERLAARPDKLLRPQLPRPYRAADIQRSLVLPPRIQALRP